MNSNLQNISWTIENELNHSLCVPQSNHLLNSGYFHFWISTHPIFWYLISQCSSHQISWRFVYLSRTSTSLRQFFHGNKIKAQNILFKDSSNLIRSHRKMKFMADALPPISSCDNLFVQFRIAQFRRTCTMPSKHMGLIVSCIKQFALLFV